MDSRAVSIKIFIQDRWNVTYFQTTHIQKKNVKPIPTQSRLKKNNKAFYFPNIYQEKIHVLKLSRLIIHIPYISEIIFVRWQHQTSFCINLIFTSTITLDFRWEHTCTRFAFPLFQEPLPADITLVNVESVQFECPLLWNSSDVQTDCAAPTACSITDDTVQRTCHLLTQL